MNERARTSGTHICTGLSPWARRRSRCSRTLSRDERVCCSITASDMVTCNLAVIVARDKLWWAGSAVIRGSPPRRIFARGKSCACHRSPLLGNLLLDGQCPISTGRPIIKPRSAQPSLGRHQPQCRDSGQYSRALSVRAAVGRPSGSLCDERSAWLCFVEAYAFRNMPGSDPTALSMSPQSERTAEWTDDTSPGAYWETALALGRDRQRRPKP